MPPKLKKKPSSTVNLKRTSNKKQNQAATNSTSKKEYNCDDAKKRNEKISLESSRSASSELQGNLLRVYTMKLLASKRYFALTFENNFAVADCDDEGNLLRSYCVIQVVNFFDSEKNTSELAICSCKSATQQKLRLKENKTEIFNETLANFTQREEGLYCIHSKGFKEIRKSINCSNYEQEKDLSDSEDNEADEVIVDQLQMKAPILTRFISHFRVIPTDTRAVLLEFIETIAAPLTTVQLPEPAAIHLDDNYQDSKLDVFLSLNQVYGLPKFKSDSLFHRENGKDTEDSCRKKTKGHPSLSPGIFTVYCPHQICYGFSVMRDHESPRVPFNIFCTRFSCPPKTIVYDNACKLHQFCLNRDPHFFKNTVFVVDRFHWKGHIGCSKGYNLNEYNAALEVNCLNSQVNEQENAGRKRLSGMLAYMTLDNFIFHVSLFYGVKNMSRLDLV